MNNTLSGEETKSENLKFRQDAEIKNPKSASAIRTAGTPITDNPDTDTRRRRKMQPEKIAFLKLPVNSVMAAKVLPANGKQPTATPAAIERKIRYTLLVVINEKRELLCFESMVKSTPFLSKAAGKDNNRIYIIKLQSKYNTNSRCNQGFSGKMMKFVNYVNILC